MQVGIEKNICRVDSSRKRDAGYYYCYISLQLDFYERDCGVLP
jgi:hypothetical protein